MSECCRVRQVALAKRRVRVLLWRAWLRKKARRNLRAMAIRMSLPTTLADWQTVLDRAGKVT